MSTRPLSPEGPFGRFAERLLLLELPELPADRRAATVAFTCRRAGEVPTPLRIGLSVLSTGVGVVGRIVGHDRLTGWLQHSRIPFVGELSRMVRSLSFAFVWETWPRTSPLGAPTS